MPTKEQSWTDAYKQFMDLALKHFPYQDKIYNAIEELYSVHRGDPLWDEAWERWNETYYEEDANE